MTEYKKGILATIGSQLIWGALPIYWHMLRPVNSWVIITYRIFTVFIFSLIIARKLYSWEEIAAPLKDKKIVIRYIVAGGIITVNWSTYIWAVNANHVIETSIGYYIQPLMVVLFGVIFFHERLTKYKMIAIVFAAVSVMVVLIHFGKFPIIALMLALTFSIYSVIKKKLKQPAFISLVYETVFYAPFALALIIYLENRNIGALHVITGPLQYILLLLCGLMTVIPLGLFAAANIRIPLITVGVTQYISPTIQLIMGVMLFKEPFDRIQFIAFAIIWIGLVFFTVGEFKAFSRDNSE